MAPGLEGPFRPLVKQEESVPVQLVRGDVEQANRTPDVEEVALGLLQRDEELVKVGHTI